MSVKITWTYKLEQRFSGWTVLLDLPNFERSKILDLTFSFLVQSFFYWAWAFTRRSAILIGSYYVVFKLMKILWKIIAIYTFQILYRNTSIFYRVFHKRTKLAIVLLIPTLYSNIFRVSLFILYHLSVNMKLDVNAYQRIIFQGCRLQWYSSLLVARPKRNWQCWHSCIEHRLWKTLMRCRWRVSFHFQHS